MRAPCSIILLALVALAAAGCAALPRVSPAAVEFAHIEAQKAALGNATAHAISARTFSGDSAAFSLLTVPLLELDTLVASFTNTTQLTAASAAVGSLAATSLTATSLAATSLTATSLTATSLTTEMMSLTSLTATSLTAASLAATSAEAQTLQLVELAAVPPAAEGRATFFMNGPTRIQVVLSTGVRQQVSTLAASDARFKVDLAPLPGGALRGLAPYSYAWAANATSVGQTPGAREFGLLAQEVQKIAPSCVTELSGPDGPFLVVDYARLVPLVIAAHRELEARLAALEERLAARQ